MLKSVGDSTPPCRTPILNWRCVDVYAFAICVGEVSFGMFGLSA